MLNIKENSHIFFIGIGGVGMSALATILNSQGYKISGSDNSSSDAIEKLINQGINVFIGHNKENITSDIDYIVYTNAVNSENPEIQQAEKLNIPLIVRAKMLNFVGSHFFSIGVSGTHGKTTTTSMTAKIFLAAGIDPSLAVGGYLAEIDGSGYFGKSNTMIYEACEAFGSLNYLYPDMALLTNIDEDHLEFFKNRQEVEDLFLHYFNTHLSPNSLLIWNADDEGLALVVAKSNVARKVSVSITARGGDFWVENITLHPNSSEFDVYYENTLIGHFVLGTPGIHNVSNTLLAIAAAKIYGIDNASIVHALASFQNAKRRFEIKNSSEMLTIIDDYAHHPKAVQLTLEAARKIAAKHNAKLIAIFQPHLYSRTKYFYKEFSEALTLADSVILTDIYAAREINIDNISSDIICEEISKRKQMDHLLFESDFGKISDTIHQITENKASVVITLGAGDIWKISEKLMENICV
ncbi:MAG: UDP-N-acetylmuramate--L-alanine ligase [Brevinemataceae bacterium]